MASTFDPKRCIIIYGGVPLYGFGPGDFLTVTPAEAAWNAVSGADGEEARSKSNNKMATATISLMQTSTANAVLSALYNADVDTAGGRPTKNFAVTDLSGESSFLESPAAWIIQPPDISFGTEIKNRDWQFQLTSVKFYISGNADVAGSILDGLSLP